MSHLMIGFMLGVFFMLVFMERALTGIHIAICFFIGYGIGVFSMTLLFVSRGG